MAPTPPIALPPTTPIDLLNYVLTSTPYPTTLLICSPQTTFISSLLSSLSNSSPPSPTLHILSIAPHIQLIYTPTLSHLRAWLSIADCASAAAPPHLPPGSKAAAGPMDKRGEEISQLVVWGLVRMHEGTSDWSVQGLSSTAAALIEAGRRIKRRVVIAEEAEGEWSGSGVGNDEETGQDEIREEGPVEEIDETESHSGDEDGEIEGQQQEKSEGIYHKRLPMLNGSSRRDGINAEAGTWSGRTVEVGVVLRRWFRFGGVEILL